MRIERTPDDVARRDALRADALVEESDGNSVPAEGGTGPLWRAGLELQKLAAPRGVSHGLVERRLHALNVMLASDPLSVFDFVPLPAAGANGLRVSVIIRDDLSANLALAAHNFELVGHSDLPRSGDSAGAA